MWVPKNVIVRRKTTSIYLKLRQQVLRKTLSSIDKINNRLLHLKLTFLKTFTQSQVTSMLRMKASIQIFQLIREEKVCSRHATAGSGLTRRQSEDGLVIQTRAKLYLVHKQFKMMALFSIAWLKRVFLHRFLSQRKKIFEKVWINNHFHKVSNIIQK